MSALRNLQRLLRSWMACSDIPLLERLGYVGRVVIATLLRRSSIDYLGRRFEYDNFRIPFLLLGYPQEIAGHILRHMDAPPRTVLDIGANAGQFAHTLLHFVPDLKSLDAFEANEEIIPLLKTNVGDRIRIFPYGVGEPGLRDFYVGDEGSVGSSLSRERATWRGREPHVRRVEFLCDIAGQTGRSHYDLVKIDVEGAELEVLQHLQVKMRYLWLEVSGPKKPGITHSTSQLHRTLYERFGNYDVLYHSPLQADSVCDILLEFKEKP